MTENQKQRQLNENNLLIPKTSVSDVTYQDQHEEFQHPASTISLATLLPPASTLGTAGVEKSPPCPEPPTPTVRPAPHALTLPNPVEIIPASPTPPLRAMAQIIYRPPPSLVDFGPGILEVLPYANIAQAPYPPPVDSNAEDLAATIDGNYPFSITIE